MELQQRIDKAVSLFNQGYNCSQAVFMAYSDIFNIDSELAASISAPLGGGVGRMREVCGAVTAMSLIAGLKYPASNPDNKDKKAELYNAVQELSLSFKKENDSIICRDLLGLTDSSVGNTNGNRLVSNTAKRPCVEYVAIAARILGEKILK